MKKILWTLFCLFVLVFAICLPCPCSAQDNELLQINGAHLDVASDPGFTPNLDGHLIVSAAKSDVFVPPSSFVELAPQNNTSFVPITMFLMINERFAEKRNLNSGFLPTLNVVSDPTTHLRRIRVVLMDNTGKYLTIQECNVWSRDPGRSVQMSLEQNADRLNITLPGRGQLGDALIYFDKQCVGKMSARTDNTNLDLRSVPPGNYNVSLIASTSDGVYLPPMTQKITVNPRFTITNVETKDPVFVQNGDVDRKMAVRVNCAEGRDVNSVHVYFADEFVVEKNTASFDLSLLMKDVPSGTATVEIIGVGKDGCHYAPETLAVNVKNMDWETRIHATDEYQAIMDLNVQIEEQEQQAKNWYARASHEPGFYVNTEAGQTTDGVYTTNYLKTIVIPGKGGEYIGKAKIAVIKMGQMRLHVARLFRALKMREDAKRNFRQVKRELDAEDPTYIAAKLELMSMMQEKRPVHH